MVIQDHKPALRNQRRAFSFGHAGDMAAEVERMHIALSEIIDATDLEWAKSRALVALPELPTRLKERD